MKDRVKWVDGLRALAIIMIIYHHWGLVINFCMGGVMETTLNFLGKYGWVGVEVFYFISGFMNSKRYTRKELNDISIFQFFMEKNERNISIIIH